MSVGRRIPQIEALARAFTLEAAEEFALFVRRWRVECGETYREIGEREGVNPSTIRNYIKWVEARYEEPKGPSPSSNSIRRTCEVCEEVFTTPRADRRYCSNACRQDAYRKRKLGAA